MGLDREEQARSPASTSRACSTAARTAAYGVASTYYTGALQTVTYKVPVLPLRRRAHVHEQAAVRPEARPRHGAAALRCSRSRWTRRRTRSGIDPARVPARQPRSRRSRSPRTGCGSKTIGLEQVHPQGRRGVGMERALRQAPARPAASASRAPARTSPARACRSTGTRMPHSGVHAEARPRRRRHRVLRRDRHRPGQRHRARVRASRRCSASSLHGRARLCVADTDLTPVDLGSYSSRVTLMMGNAAIQAAERATRHARQGSGKEKLGRSPATASCSRRAASSTPSNPEKHGMASRRRSGLREKRSSARSAPSAPTRRRASPGRYRGARRRADARRTPTAACRRRTARG